MPNHIEDLHAAVGNFEKDLGRIVHHIADIAPERKDIHEHARKSWAELEFNKLHAALDKNKGNFEKFKDHGLTDSSLKLKLAEYKYRRTGINHALDQEDFPLVRWMFRYFEDAADSWLKSLTGALGTGGAIDELKDTLKSIFNR